VMIKNNIFYNQTVTNPWNVWKNCNSELNDGGNNLFFPENASGRCVATSTNSLFVDPLLSPLADNGGSTQTMALQIGSPAINAGAGCTTTDQRGATRVGVCDIGAFEYEGVVLGIDDNNITHNLKIYPNPITNQTIFFDVPTDFLGREMKIEIFSLDGKRILETQKILSQAREELFFNNQKQGIYVIRIKSESKTYIGKFISN